MEWGREEEKDKMRGTESVVVEVRTDVRLKGKKKGGRIISFPADIGGKLGAKVRCRNCVKTQIDESNEAHNSSTNHQSFPICT